MDQFVQSSGSDGILKMSNFTPNELKYVFRRIEEVVRREKNTGRGRRTPYNWKDVFFIMLLTLKHGGRRTVLLC